MAEVPPEQIGAQSHRQPHAFPPTFASASKESQDGESKAPLPKGVVLDKDGKPCRTCTSIASWRALTKLQSQTSPSSSSSNTSPATKSTPATASPATTPLNETPSDCPPDVEQLGRSTWTLLHSMAATYPEKADTQQQQDMQGFLKFFSKLYPCWVCADDFRDWMAHPSGRNQPKLGGRKEFGWWMCEAHNEVNRKLGKKEFDCRFWEERWRTGWKDGRCD
ncbi:Mitochondrial FAD-linked sulfhydryl oxidase ERV1 [Penicillium canariense]|uniref:Sulfhydryl oxidase n=1 Tax=Penicillium canariense TaxID=189055 RepID=A0A9W9HRJ8_9EURO|nr:Mitochondrial FAD-linked sulfhydryl oxidase ERV1 [Penicillium canariense]KAJ5153106.1 Mitochondrial FAD-linked sulfhydryl oxidase ERV1 [Penicillium canariense]